MTRGERVRMARKSLGLTLEKFGAKIGLRKSSLSQVENGINELTESNIKAICREFNVNEDWLRTGSGGSENMFIPEDMRYINTVGKLGNEQNDFKKFCISMLMDLPDEYWDYLYNEFKKFEKRKEKE